MSTPPATMNIRRGGRGSLTPDIRPRPSPARSDPGLYSDCHRLIDTPATQPSLLSGNSSPEVRAHLAPGTYIPYASPSLRINSTPLAPDSSGMFTSPDMNALGISTSPMTTPNTVNPNVIPSTTSNALGWVDVVQPTASNCETSPGLFYIDPTYSHSSASASREQSTALSDSDESSSVENKFYDMEPCHLAISQDDDPATSLSSSWKTCGVTDNYVRYPSIGNTQSPFIKFEDDESCRNSVMADSHSVSDDLDYSEFIDDDFPRSKKRKVEYEDARYICPKCDKPFSRTFNYNTHLETHDPFRARPYQCGYCFKSFFRPTDLKRHEQSVHLKSKAFLCDQCGAGFPRKDSLQRHKTDGCSRRLKIKKSKSSKKRKQLNKTVRNGRQQDESKGPATFEENLHPGNYISNADALRLARKAAMAKPSDQAFFYQDICLQQREHWMQTPSCGSSSLSNAGH